MFTRKVPAKSAENLQNFAKSANPREKLTGLALRVTKFMNSVYFQCILMHFHAFPMRFDAFPVRCRCINALRRRRAPRNYCFPRGIQEFRVANYCIPRGKPTWPESSRKIEINGSSCNSGLSRRLRVPLNECSDSRATASSAANLQHFAKSANPR